MKALKIVLLFAVMMFLAAPLYARDSSSGCGLGWEVNGDNSFLGTSTRGTTHATFVPTFSMSFGTSGCAKHSVVQNEKRGLHYAEGNFASLMVEMSVGQGEVLNGFAAVMGCGTEQSAFGQIMQARYGEIFTSVDITPVDMYHNVMRQIRADNQLAGSCSLS